MLIDVYPKQQVSWKIPRWFLKNVTKLTSEEKIKSKISSWAIPSTLSSTVQLTSLVPVIRDGGAFIKFTVPIDINESDLHKKIMLNLSKKPHGPWFNPLATIKCFPVIGNPWIEDLKRFPSRKVKVIFQGPDLTEEELYSQLRRYGLIIDIIPPPPGTKELPRSATVIFNKLGDAIVARNCITGLKVNETRLHIMYAPIEKVHIFRDFFKSHPNIFIPATLFLLAALAVLIFDPIRTWCIESKISGTFNFSKDGSKLKFLIDKLHQLQSILQEFFHLKVVKIDTRVSHLWQDQINKIHDINLWLNENMSTFIIAKGPKGTGKHNVILNHALKGRKNVIVIDCDKLIKSRTDSEFISNSAKQIGYFPVFPWLNSIATFIDLIVQGLTTKSSGFAESPELQFKNMLSLSLYSIRNISLRHFKSVKSIDSDNNNLKEDDYLQQHPEEKPIIIIDHFSRINEHSSTNHDFIYKELAEWAATIVSTKLAHVIFITDDIGATKDLSLVLPHEVFKTATFGDATQEAGKRFVLKQLSKNDKINGGDEKDIDDNLLESSTKLEPRILKGIEEAMEPLGGRMFDLSAFIRRVKSGESPESAVKDMIHQTSEEIVTKFITRENNDWNGSQVWSLIKKLSKNQLISYSELILDPHFKNQESSLFALERNELITITRHCGLPYKISSGKPLFRAAFKSLVNDFQVTTQLEINDLEWLIKNHGTKIAIYENEMGKLGESVDRKEVWIRMKYLGEKINLLQLNVNKYEKELSEQKKKLLKHLNN